MYYFSAGSKKKLRINHELLAKFVADSGQPPWKASSTDSGYWVQAAQFCCKVKQPSLKLCNAVRHYWKKHEKEIQVKLLNKYTSWLT